jgi:hypothetical protein
LNVSHEAGPIVAFRAPWSAPDENSAPAANDSKWLDYCRARERFERAAARRATSMIARGIHQELAQAYARQLRPGRER